MERLSVRQIEFLQERGKSRVLVQVLQKGIHLHPDETAAMCGISSLKPPERFIALVSVSVHIGDVVRIARIFRNELTQCGIRLLLPTKPVVRNRLQIRTVGFISY